MKSKGPDGASVTPPEPGSTFAGPRKVRHGGRRRVSIRTARKASPRPLAPPRTKARVRLFADLARAWFRLTLAPVGREPPRSINPPNLLRSIRPKRARRPPDASVDPTNGKAYGGQSGSLCRAEKTRCCLSGPGHEVLAISACPPSSPARASLGGWLSLRLASPGVVHLDVGRDRQGRRQQFGLLLVEGVLPLGQDAAEFAGGDVDAQLVQLFPEQRLGDVLVVVLVEDEADQVGSEVAAGDDLGGEGATRLWPSGVSQRSRR